MSCSPWYCTASAGRSYFWSGSPPSRPAERYPGPGSCLEAPEGGPRPLTQHCHFCWGTLIIIIIISVLIISSTPWLTPAFIIMEGRAWCRPLVQDPSTARDSQEQPPSAAFLMRINQLNINIWTWVTVLKILNRIIIIIQLFSYLIIWLSNILN